ncbi:hypothetical protein APB26_32605 [Pseudomonas aeruginosa]|uniref:hypothetical protein n=1 Tax=Pseudomonas aeruginosa TaxID=287 RepID=UPI00071B5F65|nr:hypothetical protein [Pseudomonas aeruginosa]KSQ21724.1 hypothetical protein APB26_32605 [Pseudomonas aeruginosa]RPV61397.1 hypothetical protein IPC838_18945 [Pseudomonas aeruginosa]
MPKRFFLIVLASTFFSTAFLVLKDPDNWAEKLGMGLFIFVGGFATALGISFWGNPDASSKRAKPCGSTAQHQEGKQ